MSIKVPSSCTTSIFRLCPCSCTGCAFESWGVATPEATTLTWPYPTVDEVYEFTRNELLGAHSLQLLIVWKLPFILADLACGFLATRLVPTERRLRILRLWMLHPMFLYAIAFFGKYESLMLLPLLIGWILLKQGRTNTGFVCIGLAVAMRLYPALLVLPMVLAANIHRRRRFELATLTFAPTVLLVIACSFRSFVAWAILPIVFAATCWLYQRTRHKAYEPLFWVIAIAGATFGAVAATEMFVNGRYSAIPILSHLAYFTTGRVNLLGTDSIFLWGLVFGLICLWAHKVPHIRQAKARPHAFDDIADAALLASLAFFALSFFNPQYASLLICLILVRSHRARDAGPAHALILCGLFLLLLFYEDPFVTNWLFAPLAPNEILKLSAPHDLFPTVLERIEWAAFGRTMLLVGALWMAFELIRTRLKELHGGSIVHDPRKSFLLLFGIVLWPAGLVGFLAMGIHHGISEGGPFTKLEDSWQTSNDMWSAVEIDTRDRVPNVLEIRLGGSVAKAPTGKLALVPRTDGGEYAITRVVWIDPNNQLLPDFTGLIKVQLPAEQLEKNTLYRLAMHRVAHERQSSASADMRLVYSVKGEELASRIAKTAHSRFFGSGAIGLPWCACVASLLGGGLLLLYIGRRLQKG